MKCAAGHDRITLKTNNNSILEHTDTGCAPSTRK